MNWLTDNPLAITGAWAVVAALAFWLYLHSREPLRRRVATLRFWNSVQSSSRPRRRKIREPWALLAQLLFLLLLILALANPHWGITAKGRSVVIVLDNSIWSQAHTNGGSLWINDVHQQAQRIVNALPQGDQVLLMSAEPNAPAVLPFTTDKVALQRAISEDQPSNGVADIPRALQLGEAALSGADRALLVYIGPGMMDARQVQDLDRFRQQVEKADGTKPQLQFLVRLVGGEIQNRGITRIDLRRDDLQPDHWHLLTQAKNYGDSRTQLTLKLSLDGQPFVQRGISLGAGEVANVENEFQWSRGGLLQAEITPPDALAVDDKATIVVPVFRPVPVALFATDAHFAEKTVAVLASNPYFQAQVPSPGSVSRDQPDVAIYQGTSLPAQPRSNAIYFLGRGSASVDSPLLRVTSWNSQHPAARWVRSLDVTIRNPIPLAVLPGDTVLASGGNPPRPLIVAREQAGHRLVLAGFDPVDSNFQLQPAFPLFIAGSLEWMTHPVAEAVDSFAAGEIDIPGPATRIIAPSGSDVPFARNGSYLRLLAMETGVYRVMEGSGERDISVNVPQLPTQRLAPTALETASPEPEALLEVAQTLWRWLAVLALAVTCLEWWLYYHAARKRQSSEDAQGFIFSDSPKQPASADFVPGDLREF